MHAHTLCALVCAEAVCGITLPRSDGTCTRCPIEVVMSDAPGRPWMAAVRIRREFEPSGGRLDHPELTTVKVGRGRERRWR